jgi:hypothetical protein
LNIYRNKSRTEGLKTELRELLPSVYEPVGSIIKFASGSAFNG